MTDTPSKVVEMVEKATSPLVVLSPADPVASARKFIGTHYTIGADRTLHHHAGEFYAWDGMRYPVADVDAVRVKLYAFLDAAVRRTKDGKTAPFQPNTNKVNNVLDALKAAANLPSTITAPAWLTDEHVPDMTLPPHEILACRNGLLHLPSLKLLPHTPLFFSRNALDYNYDPDAGDSEVWLRFLEDLWADDPPVVDALQNIFGYLLTNDTRQQKMVLLVGPKRSGKGTIARVLAALLGPANVCAPTLNGLGSNFGLAVLIGKTAAIISDARLGGRADQHAIAERLLSVSGEDLLTIDRKYLPPWTGKLAARVVLLTNELPRIADASGALASRFIILTLTESFYGREDPGLTGKLLHELPGILNWAITGWQRLTERGHFVQPASSVEAMRELEDLGSPIGAFIRDRCVIAPGEEVALADLFETWKTWCKDHGREHPGTSQSLGRDLRAAVAGLKMIQPRTDAGRVRKYLGISLMP